MDTVGDSIGESKPVCQCTPKSRSQRWVPGFPIALCLLMSMSSITVCLLMSLKTYQLENRLQMELDKASIFQHPKRAFVNEDGTLLSELSTPIGKLVEEVHVCCGYAVIVVDKYMCYACGCLLPVPKLCAITQNMCSLRRQTWQSLAVVP